MECVRKCFSAEEYTMIVRQGNLCIISISLYRDCNICRCSWRTLRPHNCCKTVPPPPSKNAATVPRCFWSKSYNVAWFFLTQTFGPWDPGPSILACILTSYVRSNRHFPFYWKTVIVHVNRVSNPPLGAIIAVCHGRDENWKSSVGIYKSNNNVNIYYALPCFCIPCTVVGSTPAHFHTMFQVDILSREVKASMASLAGAYQGVELFSNSEHKKNMIKF